MNLRNKQEQTRIKLKKEEKIRLKTMNYNIHVREIKRKLKNKDFVKKSKELIKNKRILGDIIKIDFKN